MNNICPLCAKVNPPDEWACEACGAELPAKRVQQPGRVATPSIAPSLQPSNPVPVVRNISGKPAPTGGQSCARGCGGCLGVFILFVAWAFWADYNQKQEAIREAERRDAPRKQLEATLKAGDSPLITSVDYIGYEGPEKGYRIRVGQGWAFLDFKNRVLKTITWYSKAATPIEVDAGSYDAGNGVGGYAAKVENGVVLVAGPDHVTYGAQLPKLDKWIVYQGATLGGTSSGGGGRSHYRSRRRRR